MRTTPPPIPLSEVREPIELLRGFLAGAWFHFGFTLWSSEWVYHSLLSRTPPWPDFLIAFITALVPATGLATLLLQRFFARRQVLRLELLPQGQLRCQTYTALGGDSKPFTFSLSNIENSRLTRPEVSGLNTFKLKGRFGAFVLDKQGEYKRMDILNRLLNRNEEFEEKK